MSNSIEQIADAVAAMDDPDAKADAVAVFRHLLRRTSPQFSPREFVARCYGRPVIAPPRLVWPVQ